MDSKICLYCPFELSGTPFIYRRWEELRELVEAAIGKLSPEMIIQKLMESENS